MSRPRTLGHISPVATHLIAFLMGVSLLFETQDDGALGPWRGVLISIPKAEGLDRAYLVRGRQLSTCLLHPDPFYIHSKEGDTPGVLLPKESKYLDLIGKILARKVRLVASNEGLEPCFELGRRVHFD